MSTHYTGVAEVNMTPIHKPQARGCYPDEDTIYSLFMDSILPSYTDSSLKNLERIGFNFSPTLLDSAYLYITLPEGWKLVQLEESDYYIDIIDDKGRKRGGAFLRNTENYPLPFTEFKTYYHIETIKANGMASIGLFDQNDKPVFTADTLPEAQLDNPKIKEYLERKIHIWASVYCPNWEDPTYYWDNEEIAIDPNRIKKEIGFIRRFKYFHKKRL